MAAGAADRAKNAAMAADLKRRGIYHGKRQGPGPRHNNIPVNEPGSAAYRRLMAKLRGRPQH